MRKSRAFRADVAAAEAACAEERRATIPVTPPLPPQQYARPTETPEERQAIVEARLAEVRGEKAWRKAHPAAAAVQDTAQLVGLPEAQRDPETVKLAKTATVEGHTRPNLSTVRKLTRIEMLQRSGALTAHEAAACSRYADWNALGFDTIGCTANYEGGSGGGSFGAFDLCARYEAQADARNDFTFYRGELAKRVLPAHLAIFDQIVLLQDTIGATAAGAFELARSQAEHHTRTALRLCANILAGLISHLLPIEPPELTSKPVAAADPRSATGPNERELADRRVWLFIQAAIARAKAGGSPAAIRIASPTLAALQRECGETGMCEFMGIPLHEDEGWSWGAIVISSDEMALAQLVGSGAIGGTDRGTAQA